MTPPLLDKMPNGLLAPGANGVIYVAQDGKWVVFKQSIKQQHECEDNVYVVKYTHCPLEEDEYPDIEIPQLDHNSNNNARDNMIPEEKRGRGRPRKIIEPRNAKKYGRAPTAYNMFMRAINKTLEHIKNPHEKMKIVANQWQQYKKNVDVNN